MALTLWPHLKRDLENICLPRYFLYELVINIIASHFIRRTVFYHQSGLCLNFPFLVLSAIACEERRNMCRLRHVGAIIIIGSSSRSSSSSSSSSSNHRLQARPPYAPVTPLLYIAAKYRYCKSPFFRKHKIFARFASGIKFANSFCRENITGYQYSRPSVFALYGWAAKISCNEKSKTETSRNFTAANIRWFTV